MSAGSALAALLGVALSVVSSMATATSLRIEAPPAAPTFGETRFAVATDEELLRVMFYVDEKLVGDRRQPPWEVLVDVGQENREREFRVVVQTAGGEQIETAVTTPAIRVDEEVTYELQQLYVTVTRGGERVLGLPRESFRVFDDSQRQQIVTFEGGDVPLVAALLLDGSASMDGEPLRAAVRGVETFVSSLQERDLVSVSFFGERLTHQTDWDTWATRAGELRTRLASVEAAGNTALWDVLYRALVQVDARLGRRVVVLLSDGSDVHSALDMEHVAWKASRSAAMLYWLRLGSAEERYATVWRDAETNQRHRRLLEKIVLESGGRMLDVATPEEVPSAFRELVAELRDQYVIGYYPSRRNHDGRWRDVQVRVRGGSSVRSKTGYFDQ